MGNEAQSPHGELAQTEDGIGTREGKTVVGADRLWQAKSLKALSNTVDAYTAFVVASASQSSGHSNLTVGRI
jgi:hypothetical protein